MSFVQGQLGTHRVLGEVYAERQRQDRAHGPQHDLADGTGRPGDAQRRDAARRRCQEATAKGTVTWRDIALEEVLEALAEIDVHKLRRELVQASATFAKWVEAIDARTAAARLGDLTEPTLFPAEEGSR